MKDKIVQLMKSEELTSSRLAEILEIQPSGISHLVSGRNKPGFDLLQKILRRFPKINPYWLMLDDDNMYLPDEPSPEQSPILPIVDNREIILNNNLSSTENRQTAPSSPEQLLGDIVSSGSSKIGFPAPRVKRVIILYDDGSCESYAVNNM